MVRYMIAAALVVAALAAGPTASTARAETPRQVWLQNHPIAAENIWAENHPYRAGLLPYVPSVNRVVVGPVVVDPIVVDPIVRVYRPGYRWVR